MDVNNCSLEINAKHHNANRARNQFIGAIISAHFLIISILYILHPKLKVAK